MTTPDPYWDQQAALDPRAAVWAEPGYDESVDRCLALIEPPLAPALQPGAWVLDLGCSIGRLTVPFATRHPDLYVLGLDSSATMLDAADSPNVPGNLTWVRGDGERLPWLRLDAAWSMLVFQHLPATRVRGYLHDLSAALRPGGRLRLQWVDRGDRGPHSYPHATDDMQAWLASAGFTCGPVEHALYPEWAWITAVRRS